MVAPRPDDEAAASLQRRVAALLARKARPRRHHVAAGIATARGRCFTALNIVSNLGVASTCAEQAALAQVLGATSAPISLVLSLRSTFDPATRDEIVPPCGRCRELLLEYAPRAYVVLGQGMAGAGFLLVPTSDLLPSPFTRRYAPAARDPE